MPAGKALTIMASGLAFPGPNDPAFGLYAVFSNGGVNQLPAEVPPPDSARLQVIHNSPNPTVDIYLNGTLTLNDFAYQDATPFINVAAGVPLNIGVALSTSTSVADTLVNIPVVLTPNTTNIAVASGIVGNTTTPFNLNLNINARESATDPTKVDIAVLHGSPNAPNVDIDEFFTGNIISDLAYGAFTDYLNLNPGVYDLVVRAAGSPAAVATFRADLSGLAGGAAYVFASGLLGSTTTPFGVYAALANGDVIALPLTPTASVQVIHNSPEPIVDVYVGQRLLLEDFAFRTATPFVEVPAGRNFVAGVAPANAAPIYVSPVLNLDATKDYTIFAGGVVGNASTPFALYVYDNARQTASAGQAAFSVFHGAPDAPAVDVVERLLGTLIPNLAFGSNSAYLDVETGIYIIDVKPAGADQIVATFEADLTGLDGLAARVFASGFLNGSPAFGLFAALPDGTVVQLPATQLARLQLIHNSPAPTVDLYSGDELVVDDFEFRTATDFGYFPAGAVVEIGIAPGNSTSSGDVLETATFNLTNGRTYIAIASGILGNATTPFEVIQIDNAREESTDPNTVQLAIHHGAPDAPAINIVPFGSETPLVGNLSYGESTAYLSFPEEVILFDIVATANPAVPVRSYRSSLVGAGGFAGLVFATGLLNGEPGFDIWVAAPDGSTFPLSGIARGQVIHNSPDPTVDIYIDEDLTFTDVQFRQATPYEVFLTDVPFTVGVAPAGSPNLVYTSPQLTLENGKTYTIMASGIVGNATTPFELDINDQARFRSYNGNNVDLVLYHGATDAPEVDVTLPNGTPLFDNISYGEYSDYVSVPAANYIVNLTPADNNANILQSYIANITPLAGGSATVFASGFLTPTGDQPPFQVWVALGDGTTFPLPVVTSTDNVQGIDEAQISPNPVVDLLNLNLTLSEAVNLRYRVTDLAGRTLTEGDWGRMPEGATQQQIPVEGLSAGMYFLELLGENGRNTLKFSVQR
jgi:Domain of unknown function (DUF4397)/Secretion system C-terminal sorting domain